MHKGLREPHLLLAGPNPIRLIKNLSSILADTEIGLIRGAFHKEAALLFRLGFEHFEFAQGLGGEWRQKISRFYYGAYNVKRAISLIHDGSFSTESGDHGKIDKLPGDLKNSSTYGVKLKNLREDRNLADYSHLAGEADLVQSVNEVEMFVSEFISDAREYMINAGMNSDDFQK